MLENYGIYPSSFQQILSTIQDTDDRPFRAISALFQDKNGSPNGLLRALLAIRGETNFVRALAIQLQTDETAIQHTLHQLLHHAQEPLLLTGAEAIALLLMFAKVENVFAYPGTSELALCDSVARVPVVNLINGRGDKESAFMAAGGCLLSPGASVAILHGARGLTNAAGAVADVRRNEVGTVFLVGLPSTSSAPFLPPHAEHNLLEGIGNFAKASYEITEIALPKDSPQEALRKSRDFVGKIQRAIAESRSLPLGPVLLGIPQDVAEKRWIPYELLREDIHVAINRAPDDQADQVVEIIKGKKRPLILVDDFLFKTPQAKTRVIAFAERVGAPIIQVNYTRGAMLFESLSPSHTANFVGLYTIDNKWHQYLMKNTDLLITLEDRNAYPRVMGQLPDCPKIALTSHASMTRKNSYLTASDLLIEGDVGEMLSRIFEALSEVSLTKGWSHTPVSSFSEIYDSARPKEEIDAKYNFLRREIAEVLASVFATLPQPVLIDDSQMFGATLKEHYDLFPEHLRVFGDHGGFVGAGISYATGLACASGEHSVFCTLGDQAFTNALQGLVSAGQEHNPIIYLVCNNGKSVSLLKQAAADNSQMFDQGKYPFLYNSPRIDYRRIAQEMGLISFKVTFDPDGRDSAIRNPKKTFQDYLQRAVQLHCPVLIELEVPSEAEAWHGIWTAKGKEER